MSDSFVKAEIEIGVGSKTGELMKWATHSKAVIFTFSSVSRHIYTVET